MGINKNLQLALVHIPKTAVVSIQKALSMKALGHYDVNWYRKHYSDYYKISVVRNPYDRFVSSVFFAKQTKTHLDYNFVKDKCFADILEIFKYEPEKFKHLSFRLQSEFIAYKDQIMVDQILRFENLEQDFKNLCKKFKINISLLKLNASNHKNWSYYIGSDLKKKV